MAKDVKVHIGCGASLSTARLGEVSELRVVDRSQVRSDPLLHHKPLEGLREEMKERNGTELRCGLCLGNLGYRTNVGELVAVMKDFH